MAEPVSEESRDTHSISEDLYELHEVEVLSEGDATDKFSVGCCCGCSW